MTRAIGQPPARPRRVRPAEIAAVIVVLAVASIPRAQPQDYGGYRPHYQGYGVETRGGRGGTICRVSSLADLAVPTPGTLRYCIERAAGPRFILFEVSGTIELRQGPLLLKTPFVTIAAQTAPSPGILVRGPGLIVDAHDVVIQHLRIRVGNVPGHPVGLWLRDGATRVVVDHVSVSWSVWTGLAIAAYSHGRPPGDITVTDSIVSESLACSGVNAAVPCDVRSYPRVGYSNSRGVAIGDAWNHGGPRVALLRNISAHNNDRHPEIGGASQTFLVNNLIYNPSQTPLSTFFYQDAANAGPALSVVKANVLVAGPTTPGHNGYVAREYPEEGDVRLVRVHPTVHAGSRIYLDGNYYANHCQGVACLASPAAQWLLAKDFKWEWQRVNIRAMTPPLVLPNLPLSSALPYGDVERIVTANAGARPLDRDAVDARIMRDIAAREGRVINSPSDVAGPGTAPDGFPVLAVNRRPLSGPTNPHETVDAVGRTRIEVWLEALARELETWPPTPGAAP